MTDDPTKMEVDLSDGSDDAILDEMDADAEDDTPQSPPEPRSPDTESAPEADRPGPKMEKAAKQEAIRLRQNAAGETQVEKVQNAYQQATDSFERNSQQLQQIKQQRQQSDDRIDRLEMTKERVQEQPEDAQILQTMAGGISLEVPTDTHDTVDDEDVEREGYTRSDLIDEIDETAEALEEQLGNLEEQEESLEEALTKTQMAAQRLKETKEMLGDGQP